MNTTAERVLSGPGPGPVPPGLSGLASAGAVVIGLGEASGPEGGALESADAFLSAAPEDLCVLAYCSAGEAVASALADDEDPEEALRQWIEDAGAVLAFVGSHPERTVLIHSAAAAAMPEELAQHLAVRAPDAKFPSGIRTMTPRFDRILLAAAGRAAAEQHPQTRTLLAALDASAILHSRQAPALEAEAARQAIAAMRAVDSGRGAPVLAAAAALSAPQKALHAEREARRAAEDEIARMKRSLSWRLTAPLRKVWSAFRPRLARRAALKKRIEAVRASSFFDADWYLRQYPDVAQAGADPAEHYVRSGGAEGRAPGPGFCSRAYLADHPDVAQAGINPLVHYIEAGAAEGRTVRPVA